MALYSLSYDLRNQRDYQTLYDELKKFKAVRVLKSTWCFKRFNTNTEELRNHFVKFIDSDDGLFVAEIPAVGTGYEWAGYNLDGSPNNL